LVNLTILAHRKLSKRLFKNKKSEKKKKCTLGEPWIVHNFIA
jgi:hypothetical protein